MNLRQRKPNRITGYDYSNQNYYFVTICTQDKRCLFGSPSAPSIYGNIARTELEGLSSHYDRVSVEAFVVMPNHIHAIIIIGCDMSIQAEQKLPDLSTIVGLYKSGVARKIHAFAPDVKVWQKSFYDHIIRSRNAHCKILRYIEENPVKWQEDRFYSPI